MRLALLFSGQGNQTPAHWEQAQTALAGEMGSTLLQVLPNLAAPNTPLTPEYLAINKIAQPLIFAQQMLLWEKLQNHLPRPICAAGYSLGEMAACSAAGAFTAREGVRLCAERAAVMDGAVHGESGMLAVLGLDDTLVDSLVESLGLQVAIRNAPRHVVVAGPKASIAAAAGRFEVAGASRLVHLAVRTPSHTAFLSTAATEFKKQLDELPDHRLAFPVLSAIDASVARTARSALDGLARQICTPLDWASCLQTVREMQPDAVLEIGPGNALAKLFSELAPEIPVRASDDFRSHDGIVRWLEAIH